jgi:hypothetical protein
MSFKPSELYLGIVDVFVLLLPGIIVVNGLAWLFGHPLPTSGERLFTQWLPLSYAAGLGVSTIGSALEDLFNATVGSWLIVREKQKLQELRTRVGRILGRLLVSPRDLGNNMRRAAALVGRNLATSADPISRRDADRRFARNAVIAVVVLLIASAWATTANLLLEPVRTALPLAAIVAGWRYFDQDRKYTREVYEWLIVQDALGRVRPSGEQQHVR